MSDKKPIALCSPVDERSFLGCLVQSRGEVLDAYRLEPEAFYDWAFRSVYKAILALHGAKKEIALEAVISEMGESAFKLGLESIYDICFYPSPSMARQFFNAINEKYSLRKAEALAQEIIAEITPMTDANEFCQRIAVEAAKLLPNTACENQLGLACDQLDKRLDALERGEKIMGFKAPLECWNDVFGGICDGNLYAIASRPGAGKTALMEQMITSYLMCEEPVLVFEKDMSPSMLIERMACRLARVPFWKLSKGLVSGYDISEVRRFNVALRKTPFYLFNPSGLTAERMGAIAKREIRTHSVKAVFLDHIQVLSVGKDLREGLTQASIAIRQTTTETGVPHIILAHINRNGSKGRPTPEDIKEFDQLFGDCDGMALLWTDADKTKLKAGEMLPMNVYFAKNRNGPVVEEGVLFDGGLMRFVNKYD